MQMQKKNDRRRLYGESKINTSVKQLCHKLPQTFEDYFNYVKKLHFADKPDYDYLRYLFYKTLHENGSEFDNIYDWTKTEESEEESV